jgi:FkbM family methyltransferase
MPRQDLIFDIGCHKGEDSALYLKKGFRVVAVEANPTLCGELRHRFASEIARGQFTLVENAIAAKPGHIEFYINTMHSIWGTIRSDRIDRDAANITMISVHAVTFGSLLQRYGIPRYLKIDIEGADMLCLQGLLPFSDKPDFVSFESDRKAVSTLRTELSILRRLGYTEFQLVDQKTVHKHKPPFPPREGSYTDHEVAFHSSGLFGRELPGRWLSSTEFSARYLQVMVRDRVAGLAKRLAMPNLIRGSWYDIHAAKTT